jgi:hypothetical protein
MIATQVHSNARCLASSSVSRRRNLGSECVQFLNVDDHRAPSSGGLLEWDMWARIEVGSLGPTNTLPLDHKSGSPESQSSLLTDINKPSLDAVLQENR